MSAGWLHDHWSEMVTLVVILASIGRSLQTIRAYWYVRDLYQRRTAEVSEYTRLVDRDRRIAGVTVALVALSIWSLAAFTFPDVVPRVPAPFGALFILLLVWVMTRGPIDDKRAFQRIVSGADPVGRNRPEDNR